MPVEPRQQRYDVIIIGSGIGGLGLATYLAQEGRSVLVLERHYRAGGFTHAFRRKKYLFDGAVRVVAGAEGNHLLSFLLGEAGLRGQIPFIPIADAYRAIYPEHDITVPATVEALTETYCSQFPHEAQNIRALIAEMLRVYHSTARLLFEPSTAAVLGDEMVRKYRGRSFRDMVGAFVKEPRVASMLSSLWGYYGVTPTHASALFFSYALMRYFVEGIYYVKGSFQAFADAFVGRLRSLGGELCLLQEVKQVVVQQGAVRGVQLASGAFIEAPIVVSNGDLSQLISQLVGEHQFPPRYLRRIGKLERSLPAFEVFFGTDLPLEQLGLGHETLLFDDYDYDAVFDRQRRIHELGISALGGMVLSCPSIADPGLAPPGCHTAVLTTLVPFDIGRPWKEAKPEFEQTMLAFAERIVPGLRNHITYLESGTPTTMERYTGNSQGASYGWDQGMSQELSRPSTGTPIQGLHLTGHWTGSGGGVVSVLLTSYRLAQQLTRAHESTQLQAGGVA